ncbi:MAG: DUF1566 domain-containing protein [Sulfurovum sp.]|nr:DUF1566 domain-containing protein [Sulfurovum sp.]
MQFIYKILGIVTILFALSACGGGSAPAKGKPASDSQSNLTTTENTGSSSESVPATTKEDASTTSTSSNTSTPAKNGMPIAVAKVTPTTASQGEAISFDGTKSSDSNGEITSYQWKEGDKILSRAASFTTLTLAVGTHNIILTVTDTDNETASTNVTVTIKSASAEALRLMKTGQGTIYKDFDDGFYKKGVTPDYSRDNDVVSDHITGLQWQDDPAAKNTKRTWEGAQTYCYKLKLDGGGWRLPTRKELMSLTYYTGVSPSIHPIFKNTAFSSDYYFTSTKKVKSNGDAWCVSFNIGIQISLYLTSENYVRCVRTSK